MPAVISTDLELAMHNCFLRARELRHKSITVDQLLFELIRTRSVADHLQAQGTGFLALREKLDDEVARHASNASGKWEDEPQPTLEFQKTLQDAILAAQSKGSKEVSPLDVFNLILAKPERLVSAVIMQRLRSFGLNIPLNEITRVCGLCGKRQAAEEVTEIVGRGVLCSECIAA